MERTIGDRDRCAARTVEAAAEQAAAAWKKLADRPLPALEKINDPKASHRARLEELAAYHIENMERVRLEAKADRLTRRADALWQQLQDLRR